MKKILLSLLFASLGLSGFSQDIIVTKDSKRVEAKITEINIDNIRYLKFDNLEGPVYTLPKSEVTVILFQNGQVENFATQKQPTRIAVSTNGKKFSAWNDREVMIFFKENHPDLYRSFYTGHRKVNGGRFFVIVGGIATLVGGGLLINYGVHNDGRQDVYQDVYQNHSENRVYGIASLVAGQVILAGGITLMTVGNSSKRKAKNLYMQQYGYTNDYNQPRIKLNVYGNGVGLAYVFQSK